MTQSSFRDVEQLSALLDGKLDPSQAARLEARLASDPELVAIYEELRQTRSLLRRLPQRRAPRNFTLKPAAARVRPPLPRLFPTFRLASVLASLLLFFSLVTNATLPQLTNMASEAPMYALGIGGGPESDRAMGGGGGEESSSLPMGGDVDEPAAEAPAAMEAPVEEAAPAPEEPAAKTVEPTAAAQPDAEPTVEAAAALPPVEEPQPVQEEEALIAPEPSVSAAIIPVWTLILLAVLAIASGATAFWLRWQTDRQWKTKASPKK